MHAPAVHSPPVSFASSLSSYPSLLAVRLRVFTANRGAPRTGVVFLRWEEEGASGGQLGKKGFEVEEEEEAR
uniref:Uncharacterized protein n=1 Tax=Oryza glumipatula TaxID=40148 RepID=A0A0E0AU89_9ORYZ